MQFLGHDETHATPKSNCMTHTGKPQWTLAEKEPSVTADSDLDQDGKCVTYSGHTLEPTTASIPPSGVVWHIGCSNTHYTPLTLTFDEVCPPAPEFKYEWGNWVPQQNDGTVCGGQDQREAREVCAALAGCGGCSNKRYGLRFVFLFILSYYSYLFFLFLIINLFFIYQYSRRVQF